MEIKNLKFEKTVKKLATGFITGAVLLSSTGAVMPDKVEATSYSYEENAINYFDNYVSSEIYEYLEKSASTSNLNVILTHYDKLYDFIKHGTKVKNTYYRNLSDSEQQNLLYLLTDLGNEIYEKYRSTSYFKSTCKNKLGTYITYNSQDYGYDREHKETMEYYTETLDKKIDSILYSNRKSETNLKSALDNYKLLISFIKGNNRNNGYIYSELTIDEKNIINDLIMNWTQKIEDEYADYSYYYRACINKIGWTINYNNLCHELGKYMGINEDFIINNPSVVIPTTPTVVIPTTPSVVVPTTPVTTPSTVNGTIGKNWHDSYYDPSINTSRGERDYIPEDINDLDNRDDYYRYYNEYEDYDYDDDLYVPMYVPR